jgi:hypothetical protein
MSGARFCRSKRLHLGQRSVVLRIQFYKNLWSELSVKASPIGTRARRTELLINHMQDLWGNLPDDM